jgi:hypothetical protein
MKFSPIIAGVVCAALVLASTPARACPCEKMDYDKVLAQTPVVFDGEVVRSELDTKGERQITSFRVRGVVKGLSQKLVTTFNSVLKRTPQRTITVVSAADMDECGYDFSQGPQRLIVGAVRNEDGNMVVTRCTIYNLNSSLMEIPN